MTHVDLTSQAKAGVYLRPRQIVDRYGLNERTLRRMIAEGRLEVRRIGRSVFISRDAVEMLFTPDGDQ